MGPVSRSSVSPLSSGTSPCATNPSSTQFWVGHNYIGHNYITVVDTVLGRPRVVCSVYATHVACMPAACLREGSATSRSRRVFEGHDYLKGMTARRSELFEGHNCLPEGRRRAGHVGKAGPCGSTVMRHSIEHSREHSTEHSTEHRIEHSIFRPAPRLGTRTRRTPTTGSRTRCTCSWTCVQACAQTDTAPFQAQ